MASSLQRWLLVLIGLLAGIAVLLVTSTALHPTAAAFSAGPPPGYTRAPGEEPEACAECHVSSGNTGTGQISVTAPPTYVPGQTYQVSVTHTNSDPTRLRWGFQLTALDPSDEKAGELQNINPALTQIIQGGPGGGRQYIEHAAGGTFVNQMGGASWTFNWTAPPTDVGVVTFYAAGNHANNDANTSGDFIYFTFASSQPAAGSPDFSVAGSPALQTVAPGNGTSYNVSVTPFAGFTGAVSLSVTGLPAGANASFNPASVNINDSTGKTSTLSVTTGAGTPVGTFPLTITAISGTLQHTTNVSLRVVSAASADVSVSKTASPNPGVAGAALTYRLVVTNNGPASATNVNLTDTLPSGVSFGSATTTQGSCNGTGPVNCSIGTLANGASAVVTIVVTPTASGQVTNSASVTASEPEPDASNNTATLITVVDNPPPNPVLLDQNLSVTTVINGLDQPTTMAFISANEFLVLERATGRVQRILNGQLQTPALDLAVNNASERGLLGIALHPNFPYTPWVYLYWTESSTGVDTSNIDQVALLGNRVDKFIWDGSTLTLSQNLIRLRALQADAGQPSRGNHNGGVIRFGPDGKLYIVIGDEGRRGFLQNLPCGPATTCSGTITPDDQFGGPEPDNAHLTGAILRLNDDGTTPFDNPFAGIPTGQETETTANIRRLFAYGIRNSFGMAFDPISGKLWTEENGDDAFDEINRVSPGFNGGWIQLIGPSSRVTEYKSIETTYANGSLQQNRWPPSFIASTPAEALSRLYTLPGSQYTEPEFSWKYALAPSAIGFVKGNSLGTQFAGDLFVGASRTTLYGGFLFRFKLSANRLSLDLHDSRLQDKVADNVDKFDVTESESLLIGKNFGVATDIQTGPDGNLYVVSLSNGSIYRISGKPPRLFVANLTGGQEVPPNSSTATGTATLLLSSDENEAQLALNFQGLSSTQTDSHIHGPAPPGTAAGVVFPIPSGQLNDFRISLSPQQVQDLKNGLLYINVHSANFPGGEIRGQFGASSSASSVQFNSASYLVSESAGRATVTVTRLGNTSAAASVNYSTSDNSGTNNCNVANGNASSRCDYTRTIGTVQFAAGETLKTIVVPFTDDAYAEGNENFTISLSNASSAILGSPNIATITIADNETTAGTNPIDSVDFFVHQHYIDFLGREPDPAGFQFWKNQILSCGTDLQCIEARRINVSASFFLSIEFQETGYFTERTYKAAYGNGLSSSTLGGLHLISVPIIRLNEFLPDSQAIAQGVIVGQGNWQQKLDDNKNAYTAEFVQRAQFLSFFPLSLTAAQFVDKLNSNAGNPLSQSERNQLVNDLASGAKTRAQVLRAVVEDSDFVNAEFNRAFVLMQYFGYLRRNPNDPQDSDYTGYDFWLTKLNQFNGNYINAEMVKAFLSSIEYRQRFGQ